MNSQVHTFKDLVEDPDKRFKEFFDYNCTIKLNPNFTIDKYMRSGKELLRMANIYFSEQDYTHAFVLYSRYAVLYSQTIKSHPQYSTADKVELAAINNQMIKNVFPKAEKLKTHIKESFANEAKERKRLLETSSQKVEPPQPSAPFSRDKDDYESIKNKYDIQNQQELNDLVEKELKSMPGQKEHEFRPPSSSAAAKGVPAIDRSLKPHSHENNKYNFRNVIVPSDTVKKFLDIAQSNTMHNIETCGILAGRLSKNTFLLTHCIIPKQKGTSDTCSTEHEHELCEIIDSNNLITLGWIHTHPSQTAFLSSIDLHTHFGYQLMIPEAIAIVCAPLHNQVGMYVLSPFGIKEISECNLGGFHPHTNNPELFEECDHVILDDKTRINTIDLRVVSGGIY